MRRLALIGASGVELTAHYARIITAEIEHRYSGKLLPDFITLTLQPANQAQPLASQAMPETRKYLSEALASVERLGAKAFVLCSRETHELDVINTHLEALSICEPVTAVLRQACLRRIGLLGARTSRGEKYWQYVLARAGVCDVLLPVPRDREYLAEICVRQFSQGIVTAAARADVVRIAHSLRQAGARAVVVLSPELTAVLEDCVPVLPLYDATELHAFAAVEWMIDREEAVETKTRRRESMTKTAGDGSAEL